MQKTGRFVWAFWVGLALASPSHGEPAGTLVVANKAGDTISFVDLLLKREVARVPVGRAPHEIALSPDGATLLVGEYGPDDDPGGTVAIVDLVQARVSGRMRVGEGTRPHSVGFLPDGLRAVVTLQERDELAVVDVARRRVLHTHPTGGRESHMVRLSPDGAAAYVTSRRGEGTLSVLSLDATASKPVVIATGAGAEGLAVTPDGSEVWVLDRDAGRVSIVDARSHEIVHRIELRSSPNRIEIGAGGRAVITNGTSSRKIVQYLNVYDVATRERLHEVPLRGGEPHAGAFGILIEGERIFISDTNGGRVLAFDLDDPVRPTVLLSGRAKERPDGMVWSPLRVQGVGGDGSEAK